ncbi:glycoside hydrolase family 76 protein [Ganoderma leucocontextum]|nr:glycoside hydrolase family 76 protein [Ganoderma leucocontextum]
MLFNFDKLVSTATLVTLLSTLSTYPTAATASSAPLLVSRAQCAAKLSTATSVASHLQSKYWNGDGWNGVKGRICWTDANTIEDLYNLMLAKGSTEFNIADSTTIATIAMKQDSSTWKTQLHGYNDDAGWVVLALLKVADYKNIHNQNSTAYMNSAKIVYDLIAAEWDNTCGGGVWWSSAHAYKNAVTNELFLHISAKLYNHYKDAKYLTNAKKTWTWLLNSGMRNSQGLWNDGLTLGTCKSNNRTTWTYNQGVIASGLAQLYLATNDSHYLTQAEITLDAAIAHKTENGILKETCDNASPTSTCGTDGEMFKGIWMKHLQYYLDLVPSRASKYKTFIGKQESGVVHYGTGPNWTVGNVWYAANKGGSLFTSQTQTSGLAAHNCAAKYGPC